MSRYTKQTEYKLRQSEKSGNTDIESVIVEALSVQERLQLSSEGTAVRAQSYLMLADCSTPVKRLDKTGACTNSWLSLMMTCLSWSIAPTWACVAPPASSSFSLSSSSSRCRSVLCFSVFVRFDRSASSSSSSSSHRVYNIDDTQTRHYSKAILTVMATLETSTLLVPSTRRSTLGDRSFPVAAARAWNALPQHVRNAPSLSVFRRELKTVLFLSSFPDAIWQCTVLYLRARRSVVICHHVLAATNWFCWHCTVVLQQQCDNAI